MSSSGTGQPGQAGLNAATSRLGPHLFIVSQVLSKVRTAGLVQVQSCTNDGGVEGIGFVDVVPIVGLIDGLGGLSPDGIIYQLCYMRQQAGNNAIIMDPQEGDIGLAVFCDRDISAAKNLTQSQLAALAPTTSPVPPGSRRRFDHADGVYCMSVFSPNGPPTQFWRFSSAGMNATDLNGNTIAMGSSGILFNNTVLIDRNGNVSGVKDFTNTGNTSLSGGSTAIELSGGGAATKVKAT